MEMLRFLVICLNESSIPALCSRVGRIMLHFLPIMLFQYAQNCTYYAQTMPIISGRSKLVCSNNYFTLYRKSKLKQDGSSLTTVVSRSHTPFRKSGCGHANIMVSSM